MPRSADARAALRLVTEAGGVAGRVTTHGTIYHFPNGATLLLASSMGGRALVNFKAALRRATRTAP